MYGIYKITNTLNNKSYISKSSMIEERWEYHKKNYENPKEWDKTLYQAFRKYGLENFTFEVIEEMPALIYDKLANNREEYWIIYYNSLEEGYNETSGGDGGYNKKALEKTRKLTLDEVKEIRKIYNECEMCFDDAYQLYQNKISRRGFQAVWLGQNYKNINPEVFTEENKQKRNILERKRTGALRKAKHNEKIL